jgi:hypothetical protein
MATFNQGPWNVGNINKLFHVKLSGNLFAGLASFPTSTFSFDNPTLWGVQMIAHGDTPLDLVSGANDYRWLGQGAPNLGPSTVVLDGTSTNFYYGVRASIAWDWFGQLPNGGVNVDFYLSFADAWSTGESFAVGGMLEVDWN